MKNKKIKLTIANLVVLFFVIGCGSSNNKTNQSSAKKLGNYAYRVDEGEGSTLKEDAGIVKGSGKISFQEVDPKDKPKSFKLKFDLETNGSLTLFSKTDAQTTIQVTFSYVDSSPTVTIVGPTAKSEVKQAAFDSEKFPTVVEVGVHNHFEHSHAMVGIRAEGKTLTVEKLEGGTTNGSKWGLILKGATVHNIEMNDYPGEEH